MTLSRVLLAVVVALLLLIGVQQCKTVSLERKLTAAKLEPQKQAVATAQARVDTVTVWLAAAKARVLPALETVRVDTLMLAPVTAQDTAKAVAQLPTLAVAHDSLQRACSAFVVTCGEYRAASESRDSASRVLIRGLEDALKGARPSRLGAMWNRGKLPAALLAGVYLGTQVSR